MDTTCPPHAPSKLLGLELLRCVAAFAVLVWHYQHFAFNGTAIDVLRTQQPFYALLWPFYEYGWYGVQVFWCISGFIFFWRYRDSIAEGAVSGWKFFVLRFSRLYPLHLLTLLLVAVLQMVYSARCGHGFVYQYNDARHFVMQLFLASHWGWQSGYSFNGPIWSISIEALVYLAFFASVRMLGTSTFVNVVAVVLSVALKLVGFGTPISECLGLFFGGGLAAAIFLRYCGSNLRIAMRVAALVAPAMATVTAPSERFIYYFLLAYLPVLLFCLAHPLSVEPRAARIIEAAGNMTYASYLLHFPLQLMLALCYKLQGKAIPLYGAWFFVLFISVTGVAAYAVYRSFELPAQRSLRGRLLGRDLRSAAAGGT